MNYLINKLDFFNKLIKSKMSDDAGSNKRKIKKTKTGAKTLNIKISTEDKDIISNNNNKKGNKQNQKSASKTNQNSTEKEDIDIFQQTKNLNKELDSLNSKIQSSTKNGLEELKSLNDKLSELEEEQVNLTKKNYKLLSELKNIENNVSTKFEKKFKMSKIVSKQKKLANKTDLNVQIKAKEGQTQLLQKNIERNKKDLEVLQQKIEKAKDMDTKALSEELNNLNKEIEKKQNEIKNLNVYKEEHENCEKKKSTLKSKINVLSNEIDFENKRKNMSTKVIEKKPKTKIIMSSKAQQYGKDIRAGVLENVEEKYSSKRSLIKFKFFNYLINEFDQEIDGNTNTSRKKNNNTHLKTSSNENSKIVLPPYLRDINSKIDNSSTKKHLFSDKEKEVLKVLVPEEYMTNFNERYKNIENQINEIEKETNKENEVIKSEIDNNKLKIDEIGLKIKEENIKKIVKNSEIKKNDRKISDLKKEITKIKSLIKEEEKKISKTSKSNEYIKKILNEFKKKKEEEEQEQEDNQEQEEEQEQDEENNEEAD